MPREQRHLAAVRTDPAAPPGQRLSGPESDVSSGDGSPLPLLRQDVDRQVELETQPVADRKNRQGIRKVNKLSLPLHADGLILILYFLLICHWLNLYMT